MERRQPTGEESSSKPYRGKEVKREGEQLASQVKPLDVVKEQSKKRPQRVEEAVKQFKILQEAIEKNISILSEDLPPSSIRKRIASLDEAIPEKVQQAKHLHGWGPIGRGSREKGEKAINAMNKNLEMMKTSLEQWKELKEKQVEFHEALNKALDEDRPHFEQMAEEAVMFAKGQTLDCCQHLEEDQWQESLEKASTNLKGACNVHEAIIKVIQAHDRTIIEEGLKKKKVDSEQKIKVLGAATVGKDINRPNQDACFYDEEHQIFCVCDGVGSCPDSHIAARLASQRLPEELSKLPDDIDKAKEMIPDIVCGIMEEINIKAKEIKTAIKHKFDERLYENLKAKKSYKDIEQELNKEFVEDRLSVVSQIYENLPNEGAYNKLGKKDLDGDLKKEMKDFKKKMKEEEKKIKLNIDMATTASSVILKNGYAIIVNIGDSRVYHQRSGSQLIEQATYDQPHTGDERRLPWVYQKVAAYLPSFEGLSGSLQKTARNKYNMDTAIGSYQEIPDYEAFKKQICNIYVRSYNPGDKLILTSDGIHDNLTDDQIASIVSNPKIANPAKALIDEATKISQNMSEVPEKARLQRSKPDDMTAMVVQL